MQLYDRVASQKIGPPALGKVVGIMDARYWAQMTCITDGHRALWNKLYPGWLDKRIIQVYSDSAQKPMTIEEFMACVDDDEPWTSSTRIDYINLPETHFLAYPEDDLSMIGEWE